MAPAPRFLRTWRGTAGIRTSGAQRGTFLDNGGTPDRRGVLDSLRGGASADGGVRGGLIGGGIDFSMRRPPKWTDLFIWPIRRYFVSSSHFVLTRPFLQSVFYLTAVLSPSLIYLVPNEPTYTLSGTSVSTSLLPRASLAPFVSIYLIFQLFAERCLLGKR